MPLYEYRCDQCGELFEVMQKFADERIKVHEKCGGPVQRLLSVPALQFKGSGWYVNDYAKSGSGSPPAGNSESTADNGKKATEGSPAKSDSSSTSTSSNSTPSPASDKK